MCWARDETCRPGQDLVRAWYVPGSDRSAGLARYSRAITAMHAAGWRVDQLPAAIGGLLDVLLIGAPDISEPGNAQAAELLNDDEPTISTTAGNTRVDKMETSMASEDPLYTALSAAVRPEDIAAVRGFAGEKPEMAELAVNMAKMIRGQHPSADGLSIITAAQAAGVALAFVKDRGGELSASGVIDLIALTGRALHETAP